MVVEDGAVEQAAGPEPVSVPPSTASGAGGDSGARGGCWKAAAIVLGIFLVLLIGAGAWYWYYFHASQYRPTELSEPERVELEEKIEVVTGQPVEIPAEMGEGVLIGGDPLDDQAQVPPKFRDVAPGGMTPGERRTLVFTEREINGFIGHNTELGERLYIDLKPGMIVAKVVWPFEEETPFVGGKTMRLRFSLGAEMNVDGQMAVVIRDVSVGGISIPNTWMGDLKGKNLVELEAASGQSGFWEAFAAGVSEFEIANDELRVKLNE
jgi:hypothetical protein